MRVRSVRAEFGGGAVGSLALAAIAGVASVIVGSPDGVLGMVLSGLSTAVGVGVVTLMVPIPARYRDPRPWRSGVVAESDARSFWVTAVLLTGGAAVVVAVCVVFSLYDADMLSAWAGIGVALAGSSWIKQRRMAQLEAARKVTVYREIGSWRRPRASRQAYARQ